MTSLCECAQRARELQGLGYTLKLMAPQFVKPYAIAVVVIGNGVFVRCDVITRCAIELICQHTGIFRTIAKPWVKSFKQTITGFRVRGNTGHPSDLLEYSGEGQAFT